MATLQFNAKTSATPEQWVAALTDFGPGRSEIFENSADDAVPQSHTQRLHDACASKDKTMHVIKGANHYYTGQDDLMQDAVQLIREWLEERGLLEA